MGSDNSKAAAPKSVEDEEKRKQLRAKRLKQLELQGFIFKDLGEVLEWLELIEAPESVSLLVRDFVIDGEGLLTIPQTWFCSSLEDILNECDRAPTEEEKDTLYQGFVQSLQSICMDWAEQQRKMMDVHYAGREKEFEEEAYKELEPVDPSLYQQQKKAKKKKKASSHSDSESSSRKIEVDDFFPPHRIPTAEGREAVVIYYHNVTKHEAKGGARGLKADWALQPSPFRRYYTAPYTLLNNNARHNTTNNKKKKPAAAKKESPVSFEFDWLFDEFYDYRLVPPCALNLESLHDFFTHSLALSAMKQTLGNSWTLRVVPSSGGLHPTESYVILPKLEGLKFGGASAAEGCGGGLFHYSPKEHGLELRHRIDSESWAALTSELPAGSFFIALTSVIWREVWKYGERGFRYCELDIGHAYAGICIAARLKGWRVTIVDALTDAQLCRLLGIRGETPSWSHCRQTEYEGPAVLALVYPASSKELTINSGLSEKLLTKICEGRWHGMPNRLSVDHDDWKVIKAVIKKTRKKKNQSDSSIHLPACTALPRGEPPLDGPSPTHGIDARKMIRQRRSSLGFHTNHKMPRQQFYWLMKRLLPIGSGSLLWDTFPAEWYHGGVKGEKEAEENNKEKEKGKEEKQENNEKEEEEGKEGEEGGEAGFPFWLGIFVLRVEGLKPGLYACLMDPSQKGHVQSCIKKKEKFVWKKAKKAPEGLHMYLLREYDLATVSKMAADETCFQEVAGDGCFSLGIFGRFDSVLKEKGAHYYRYLHWGAGAIGQLLYVQAEAFGLRGTGLGCYLDDPVHKIFGIKGTTYQTLYHFTVGLPQEDPRIHLFEE